MTFVPTQPLQSLRASLLLVAITAWPASAVERRPLEATVLELPAAPAIVFAADVDQDGHQDLVTALVHLEWDQETVEERQQMDDIEGLVEVLTIVPVLSDRRELRVVPGTTDGWQPPGLALPLDPGIHTLLPGPPGAAVLALTDDGISVLRQVGDTLGFEPWIEDSPILAGSRALVPDLPLSVDVTGDDRLDVLVPAVDGLAVYPADAQGGLQVEASSRVSWPPENHRRSPWSRSVILPEVRDADGDGLPDLLFPDSEKGWHAFQWARNLGEGRFSDLHGPVEPLPVCSEEPREKDSEDRSIDCRPPGTIVWVGDLDGRRGPEILVRESLETEDAGVRTELREAKRPPFRYRVHGASAELQMDPEPRTTFEATGYTFEGDGEGAPFPGGFQDLDGDGDLDLVALTLDFSVFQAARVMTTGTFGLGLDFHLHCQDEPGYFRPVENLDLSGKLKLRLDNVRLSHRSLFGDFDADGRADFVQMGRGRNVTIQFGREGCSVSAKPDLALQLEREPDDLALVRILDLDGDGRSDLTVTRPGPLPEDGTSRTVHLEIYRNRADGETR